MSGEAKFQTRVHAALRGQGMLVQKFTDRFSLGIADTLVQVPVRSADQIKRYPPGMWMELKATEEVPSRPETPWSPKMRPTVEQFRWLREFGKGVFPTMVIFNTPHGWTVRPPDGVDEFLTTPHEKITLIMPRAPITYAAIFREYQRWTR